MFEVVVPLLWAVGWSGAVLWLRFKLGVRLSAWREGVDTDFALLDEHQRYLHKLFGSEGHQITYVLRGGDTLAEVHVRCNRCDQKNRVKARFRDAVCGRCKMPFHTKTEKLR